MARLWQDLHGTWFFIASSCSLVAFLVLGQQPFLAAILLGLVLCRIYVTKNFQLFKTCLSLSILFAGYCLLQQPIPIKQLPAAPAQILIQSDTIHVAGDSLTFQSRGQLNGKTVKFAGMYTLATPEEKQYFQQNWHNLEAKVIADLELPKPATNHGQFDFQKYLWQQKRIRYSLRIKQFQSLKPQTTGSFKDKLSALRQRLLQYFNQAPPALSTYLKGLILGQFHDDPNLRQDLSSLGVIHLFSLSGLHVFILLEIIFVLGSRCHLPKEYLEWGLLGLLPIYGLLVGSGTGIRRAVSLVLLTIILNKCQRPIPPLDKISLVLLSQLWVNPYTLFTLGGLLSYVLAFSLVFNQHRGLIAQQLMLSFSSLPIILYFQYEWHLLSILLNLMMIPLFEMVVMPLILISSFLPMTGTWAFTLNSGLTQLNQSLHWLTNLDQLQFVFGRPPLIVTLSLVLLSFAVMNQRLPKIKQRWLMGYLGVLGCVFIGLHNPIYGQVTLLDIGQGDSLLITTPLRRKVILIDTSGKLNLPKKPWQQHQTTNNAQKITVPYLKMQGIHQIDTIFLTHQDADHLGDLPTILAKFKVKQIVFAAGLEANPHFYKKLRGYAQTIKLKKVLAGATIKVGALKFLAVHPFQPGSGKNEDSLVLLSRIHHKNWLFMGDCYQDGEQRILQNYQVQADYIKLGHHGSKTSSNKAFLENTQAKLALISSGRHNHYGHPSPETMDTLKQLQLPFLNTQTSGMINWTYGPFRDSRLRTFGL